MNKSKIKPVKTQIMGSKIFLGIEPIIIESLLVSFLIKKSKLFFLSIS